MGAVFKRELKSYFGNLVGYMFIAFLLLCVGLLSVTLNYSGENTSFSAILPSVLAICAISIPVLTMRSFAEEKAQKTDKLLYSLPVSMNKIIAAKFFATELIFAIPCLILCVYPLIMSAFGTVRFANDYTCLFAFFLCGSVFISIGILISCLTDNQISAAFVTMATLLIICLLPRISGFIPSSSYVSLLLFALLGVGLGIGVWLLTKSNIAGFFTGGFAIVAVLFVFVLNSKLFENGFAEFLKFFCVYERFNNFVYGLFDLRTVFYYISLIFLFLFLSVQAVEKKRWN